MDYSMLYTKTVSEKKINSKNCRLLQHEHYLIDICARSISRGSVYYMAVAKHCTAKMRDTVSLQPLNCLISIYFIHFRALKLQLLAATHTQAPRPGEDELSVFSSDYFRPRHEGQTGRLCPGYPHACPEGHQGRPSLGPNPAR